jgi:alpha-D-xyloside xylohydrolase
VPVDPSDPRGWAISDAYHYGPGLWVAPVLDDGPREREVALPRGDWIETRSGRRVRGGGEVVVDAPLERIPRHSRPQRDVEVRPLSV